MIENRKVKSPSKCQILMDPDKVTILDYFLFFIKGGTHQIGSIILIKGSIQSIIYNDRN